MILLENIKVRHYAVNALVISWDTTAAEGDVTTDYTYELQRSQSEHDGFEAISDVNHDTLNFVDHSVNTLSFMRVYFYKVVATSIANPTISFESEVGWIGTAPDCIALEVMRKERLYLRQYIKTRVYIYTARTTGNRCSECWNPITGEVTRRSCPSCFNTGFEGGFFKPQPTYVDFSAEPSVLSTTSIGPIETRQVNAWTSSFPIIKNNDLIREVDGGIIWRVENIGYVKKNRFKLKQMLSIVEVEKRSLMYDLEIPTEWVEPWDADYLTGVPHVQE